MAWGLMFVSIVPAIGMAGYQCLMPLASFIYLWVSWVLPTVSWVLLALYSSVPFSVRMRCSVPILKPLPDQLQVAQISICLLGPSRQ